MHLFTERLELKGLKPEDWQLFHRVHTDKTSMEFISAVPQLADIRQRFHDRLAPWQVTSFHMLCLTVRLKSSGEILGLIGANAEWAPYRQAEVGYSFLSEHFGRGYGSEALGALAGYLFEHCEFHKLKAQVVEGNWASRRVLEKNGFILEGTLRDNYLLRGQWCERLGVWKAYKRRLKIFYPASRQGSGLYVMFVVRPVSGQRRSDGPGANVNQRYLWLTTAHHAVFPALNVFPLTCLTSRPN